MGLPIFLTQEVKKLQFDKIVIMANRGGYTLVHDMLAYGYGIGDDKVTNADYLIRVKIIKNFMDGKYKYLQDAEIEQTVRQLEAANDFDLWCGYCPKLRETLLSTQVCAKEILLLNILTGSLSSI